jgi:hypothetical protein
MHSTNCSHRLNLTVSRHEIEKVIKSLKPSNSYGYDQISVTIIKESSPFICAPLTRICNQSLLSGIFLDHLKYPDIKPIYMNDDKHNMTNYRTMSLLPSFSKIFENLIFTRLLQKFTNNNILSKEQVSFRANSSTDNTIFKLLNGSLNALNNKLTIGGILCNLEKAIDCVDHNILLSKLQHYGVISSMYTLIQSHLTRRYQRVVFNPTTSNHNIHSKCSINSKGIPCFF